MHALAREPRFRPASAAEFAHELAAASELPAEPLLATAVTEPLPARRYGSVPGGSAWLWIAGAAAVAIVAVILGLLSLGGAAAPRTPSRSPSRSRRPRAVRLLRPRRETSARWLRAHSR